MDAHNPPLVLGQLSRLVKNGVTDPDLSNIMEKRASFQRFELLAV
jgi:hypothetical protein